MKSRKLRKKTYKKKNKKNTYRGGMQQSQGEGISDLPVVKVDVIESWKLMMKRMMDLFESNFKNTMNFAKQINDKDARKQAIETAEYFMANGVDVYFVDIKEKDPSDIGFGKIN